MSARIAMRSISEIFAMTSTTLTRKAARDLKELRLDTIGFCVGALDVGYSMTVV